MRRSYRSRAELGKPVGGIRPFGWLDDRLTLDPLVCYASGADVAGYLRNW